MTGLKTKHVVEATQKKENAVKAKVAVLKAKPAIRLSEQSMAKLAEKDHVDKPVIATSSTRRNERNAHLMNNSLLPMSRSDETIISSALSSPSSSSPCSPSASLPFIKDEAPVRLSDQTAMVINSRVPLSHLLSQAETTMDPVHDMYQQAMQYYSRQSSTETSIDISIMQQQMDNAAIVNKTPAHVSNLMMNLGGGMMNEILDSNFPLTSEEDIALTFPALMRRASSSNMAQRSNVPILEAPLGASPPSANGKETVVAHVDDDSSMVVVDQVDDSLLLEMDENNDMGETISNACLSANSPLDQSKKHARLACLACIRGHRAPSCKHTDRPLFPIRPRGRPSTQCSHCKAARRSGNVNVKCLCGTPIGSGVGVGIGTVAGPSSHHVSRTAQSLTDLCASSSSRSVLVSNAKKSVNSTRFAADASCNESLTTTKNEIVQMHSSQRASIAATHSGHVAENDVLNQHVRCLCQMGMQCICPHKRLSAPSSSSSPPSSNMPLSPHPSPRSVLLAKGKLPLKRQAPPYPAVSHRMSSSASSYPFTTPHIRSGSSISLAMDNSNASLSNQPANAAPSSANMNVDHRKASNTLLRRQYPPLIQRDPNHPSLHTANLSPSHTSYPSQSTTCHPVTSSATSSGPLSFRQLPSRFSETQRSNTSSVPGGRLATLAPRPSMFGTPSSRIADVFSNQFSNRRVMCVSPSSYFPSDRSEPYVASTLSSLPSALSTSSVMSSTPYFSVCETSRISPYSLSPRNYASPLLSCPTCPDYNIHMTQSTGPGALIVQSTQPSPPRPAILDKWQLRSPSRNQMKIQCPSPSQESLLLLESHAEEQICEQQPLDICATTVEHHHRRQSLTGILSPPTTPLSAAHRFLQSSSGSSGSLLGLECGDDVACAAPSPVTSSSSTNMYILPTRSPSPNFVESSFVASPAGQLSPCDHMSIKALVHQDDVSIELS